MLRVFESELSKDKSFFKILLASSTNLRKLEATSDSVRMKYYDILHNLAEKGDAFSVH